MPKKLNIIFCAQNDVQRFGVPHGRGEPEGCLFPSERRNGPLTLQAVLLLAWRQFFFAAGLITGPDAIDAVLPVE